MPDFKKVAEAARNNPGVGDWEPCAIVFTGPREGIIAFDRVGPIGRMVRKGAGYGTAHFQATGPHDARVGFNWGHHDLTQPEAFHDLVVRVERGGY